LNLEKVEAFVFGILSSLERIKALATLLFRLRHVPDDEAEEVRALLEQHEIDFYETSAGNWRISMPAIWIRNDDQLAQAKQLLDQYQQTRYLNAREQYEQLKKSGEQRTLWRNFLDAPFKVAFYLGMAFFVLYLSLQVFLSLG
jgi:hypothetical protein